MPVFLNRYFVEFVITSVAFKNLFIPKYGLLHKGKVKKNLHKLRWKAQKYVKINLK